MEHVYEIMGRANGLDSDAATEVQIVYEEGAWEWHTFRLPLRYRLDGGL